MTRGVASLLRARWQDAIQFHLLSPVVLLFFVGWIVFESGMAARLWTSGRIGVWAARPHPWLVFAGLCTVYGALRWWGIIGNPRA